MVEFRYYTRGGSSPQGKPRVYFTAHPDDFRFFDDICKEITDRQNCAIFYLDPDVKPEEVADFDLRLSQMQLFVVPVTTKLLLQPNRAMDVDVPLAMLHHIPVLPLMQEGGLDDLFGRRFGDLQYLDKYNTDPTAISYDEKLTKYLESVIVGDLLSAKVRTAFDAYIFLSYRKKDRWYAQELMKLIHKNPLCRDIAIWYDEFLTPGENFNDAIEAALKKSDLFALAVTPNLINEVNYILTIEYPMAKEHGKDILPVEMVLTERQTLSEQYKGIPSPVEKGDSAELERRLSELFKNVAVTKSDDPQHNFIIGLAYLSGIDVEVDHERAVELITGSAEAGCIEAVKKLVSMYQSGEGVLRDYLKAIEWQLKLVNVLIEDYNNSPNIGKACVVLDALWDLGDFCYAVRALDKAELSYAKMYECSERFYAQYKGRNFLRLWSVSCEKRGDIADARGELNEAKEYYEKGFSINETLLRETNTVQAKRDVSLSYEKLGNIAKEQGKLNEARRYYEKSMEIREAIAQETELLDIKRTLSVGYTKLGDIAMALGKPDEAREYHEKSLKISEAILREADTVEANRDVALSCERLGDIVMAQGKLNEAQEYYQQALTMRQVLVTKTETVESRRDLYISYSKLGNIAKAQGRLDEARDYYDKGLEISEAVARETNTVEAKRDLSVISKKRGEVAFAQGALDEAQKYFEKSLNLDETVAWETNTVQAKRDLSICCNLLGDIAQAQRRLSDAQDYYEKSLSISEILVREADAVEIKRDLLVVNIKLGVNAEAQGRPDAARTYYEKALKIGEVIARETNTLEAKRDLSVCYNMLGDVAQAQGRIDEAREYFEKALKNYEAIAMETQTVESYDDLAISYYKMGTLDRDRSFLQKALDIWTMLSAQCPSVAVYQERAKLAARALQTI